MLAFFRQHIVAGIGLLVGPAISIGSLVLHAVALHDMGLPVEIWEAIGAAIFFLSVVGILLRQQQLAAGPTGATVAVGLAAADSHAGSKQPATLPETEAQALRGDRYRPGAPAGCIELIRAQPEVVAPADEPGITWKRKLRVILRNRSDQAIEVRAPDWISSAGYVGFQSQPAPHFWSKLDLEDVASGGWMQERWERETNRVMVPPGLAFRASVGLDPSFSNEEINNRHLTRTIGMLVLPITIGGRELEWRVRL